jgi:single-strand DNA-binding protein
MLNLLAYAGFLTRDPELRFTPKGTAVANFCVACNRNYVVDGEKRQETTFLDFTAWGKTGESIAQYFKKGKGIILKAYLKTESWEDREKGTKHSKIIGVVESFSFVNEGSSDKDRPARSEPTRSRPARPPAPDPDAYQPDPEEDDVPF